MENFSNFVAFSQYPNFKTQMHKNQNAHLENSSTHYEKAGPRGTTNFQKSFKWKYGIFGTEKTNSGSSSMTSHHYANYLGAGKKQGHHLNLFYSGIFLKKGNLLWFSWFLHYLNSPSQTWSLGRSKMTFNLSCVFLKLLKYYKIEKNAIFDCKLWLTPS